jgi:type I restriction-modification system DNA methylase subunit
MLTIPDVARAIKNAENTKIAIENEIEKRKQSTSEKSDYQKELDRQVNEGEIEDDSQGISIYHLAKNIEETTNNQFKGVYGDYKNQYVLNKAIEELLMTKDSNYSSEEKVFIRKYSGYGGLQKFGKGGKGAFFEFYTPTEIIERMWGLAYKYGYDNGSVLETSVGTGEFFRYAPKDVRLVGYEISEYSGKICKILYPTAEINIQPFEKTFIKNNYTMKGRIDDLEKFSLVIGNPPYGDFSKVESRYMSGMGEKDYTHARNYVEYFIRRGMDLLESGGLLVFIIGASLKYGGTMFLDSDISPVKTWLSENCTLETAYRLPDSVFERTGVTADIIVLKKN